MGFPLWDKERTLPVAIDDSCGPLGAAWQSSGCSLTPVAKDSSQKTGHRVHCQDRTPEAAALRVTGEELFDCVGHKGATTVVQLHPQNPQRLVSCSLDGTVRVWDVTDGALLHTFPLGDPITHAVFPAGTPGVGYAALLRSPGPKGSERYVPGQEVARLQQAKGKGAHPEIEIVQLDIPGLGDAVSSLDDAAVSISRTIVAPQRGLCTGFDVREPESTATATSFVVGAPGGVRLLSSDSENDAAGGLLVVFGVHRNLYVWDTAGEVLSTERHARPLTCLSVHPFADYVVAGDVEGQMVAFHCLSPVAGSDASAPAARTTRHWHAHAAACCDVTPDGSLLLSGGEEAVLVMWQLGGREDRNFLPRLGAPLRSVTSSFPTTGTSKGEAMESLPPVYAVGLGDCSLLMVDAGSLREMWRVRGLAVAGAVEAPQRSRITYEDSLVQDADQTDEMSTPESFVAATPSPRGPGQFLAQKILVDPRSGHVIVNGFPGKCSLQFYDVYRRRHVRELEVAPRNMVSRVDDTPPPVLAVTQAVLSADGESMATVERNSDGTIGSNPVLKFWTFSAASQRFIQTTRVDDPHKGSDVVVMDYHPSSHLVFTAASPRSFKVWQRQTVRPVDATLAQKDRRRSGKGRSGAGGQQPQSEYVWSCRSAGFFRDLPITTGCFSGDGSLLAVVFGHVITVWSPLSNTLCGTLTHTTRAQPYRHVAFLGQSAYLVAATDGELQVWNLLSQTVEWSYTAASSGPEAARLVHLCVDRHGGSSPWFAVVLQMEASTDDNNSDGDGKSSSAAVLLWNAADPVPAKVWRMTPEDSVVQAAQGGLWVAAAILGNSNANGPLPDVAALSSDNKLWLLSDESAPGEARVGASASSTATPSRPVRGRLAQLTSALMAQSGGGQQRNGWAADSAAHWRTSAAADLISGATHTLPPVSVFSSDLLASLAPRRREGAGPDGRGPTPPSQRRFTADGELPPADTLANALVASARSHGEEDEWSHWGVQFATHEPEPMREGDGVARSMKHVRPFFRMLFAGQAERKRKREEELVTETSPPKTKRPRKARGRPRKSNGVASK